MLKKLASLEKAADKEITKVSSIDELRDFEIKYLGRKSNLGSILKGIKTLTKEEKAQVGRAGNEIKNKIISLIDTRRKEIEKKKFDEIAKNEWIDVTVPGNKPSVGKLNPITQMLRRCEDIFEKMGFEVHIPYEIDDDYHNFESVNIPKGHPARDAWDTFWTEDEQILITHTSSMQNRIMKAGEPPIRAIVPGKCFRNEATDARHEHTFYQIEGIYIDKNVKLTDLLGTLQVFFNEFYNRKIEVKFMPDYFPFVEPGGQMALSCILCDGNGCDICKGSGWLEILGCGMVHPKVLEMAEIDPNVYTGFAWGFGLERLIMLKNNIEDIRHFHSGDLRFIRQF